MTRPSYSEITPVGGFSSAAFTRPPSSWITGRVRKAFGVGILSSLLFSAFALISWNRSSPAVVTRPLYATPISHHSGFAPRYAAPMTLRRPAEAVLPPMVHSAPQYGFHSAPVHEVRAPAAANYFQSAPLHPRPIRTHSESVIGAPHVLMRTVLCNDTAGDFVAEKMIPTRDCSKGLYCRARLIVEKVGGRYTVEAGYIIYRLGSERSVDKVTKDRVGKVTLKESTTWATQLVAALAPELAMSGSTLVVDDVAQAIFASSKKAATCPNTGDALCSTVSGLYEHYCESPCDHEPACPDIQPSEEDAASIAYISGLSPPYATSYDALSNATASIGGVTHEYNRIGINKAPFCVTECTISEECGVAPVTVFASLWVQVDGSVDKDCIAAVVEPTVHTNFPDSLPSCDTMEGVTYPSLFDRHASVGTLPDGLKEAFQKCTSNPAAEISYCMYKVDGNVAPLVEAACASAVPSDVATS